MMTSWSLYVLVQEATAIRQTEQTWRVESQSHTFGMKTMGFQHSTHA
jgi:hypothetical protein